MRYLVLSDIHANLYAFQAVVEAAKDFDKMIFLGDISNFGPHPGECVDFLREYSPICIMGNHDKKIADAAEKRNFWDEWSREKLTDEQLKWISTFEEKRIFEENILLLHGSYDVDYDILPNTPDKDIKNAFANHMEKEIREVWFGHYHYEIERNVDNVTYRCVRPVGHHRDHDVRASYAIYENGVFNKFRVPYDIEKTIYDSERIECLDDDFKVVWRELLRTAFSEKILKKDIEQMKINEQRRK